MSQSPDEQSTNECPAPEPEKFTSLSPKLEQPLFSGGNVQELTGHLSMDYHPRHLKGVLLAGAVGRIHQIFQAGSARANQNNLVAHPVGIHTTIQ